MASMDSTLASALMRTLFCAAKGSWFSNVLFSVCRAAGKQPRKHRPWRSQKFLFVAVFPGSASLICSFKGAQGSTICPANCAERFGLVEASLKNRERPSNLGSLLLTVFSWFWGIACGYLVTTSFGAPRFVVIQAKPLA